MNLPVISIVAGPAGCGKTTWITQQLASRKGNFPIHGEKVLYFSPGTGTVPIDQIHLTTVFPTVTALGESQAVELFEQPVGVDAVYIELGSYLELTAVDQILTHVPYRRIAVLPPNLKDSEWHSWADEIVSGVGTSTPLAQAHLWRVCTTGEVVDENSLQEIWYEITHDAYGAVARAKGIFHVADGRSLYADFVAGVEEKDMVELNLPRHIDGRPQSFSGLEVLGENLDELTLGQTLQDCYLSDAAILYYQEQVKQAIAEEME